MVRTGASSYIRYDWEDTFGTTAFTDSTHKAFGLQARLGSWTLGHSPKDLPQLNQVEYRDFAYGQQNGALTVDFVLSNPWIFQALLGTTATTGSGPYVHTWGTLGNVNANARTVTPFSVEVGFAAEDANIIRRAQGCILNSLTVNTAIDTTVDCSADITYGSETDPTTTYHASPPVDDIRFPYTFAHGELRWYGDSGVDTDNASSVVAQLQSCNITIAQNPTLLYSIGSHRSVAAYRRILDITGNFQASWIDNKKLLQLLDQIEKPPKSFIREGVSGANVDAILTFTNGGSGVAKKSITIKLEGIRPDSVSIDGIVPVEPVFETINWRAKTITVVADNNIATAL